MSMHSGKPIESDAYKTAVRFSRIGMTVEAAEEAVLIFKKRPILVDMIMGHFAGFRDGQFRELPKRLAETMVDNLAMRGIIDWNKIPSIPLTQTNKSTIRDEHGPLCRCDDCISELSNLK